MKTTRAEEWVPYAAKELLKIMADERLGIAAIVGMLYAVEASTGRSSWKMLDEAEARGELPLGVYEAVKQFQDVATEHVLKKDGGLENAVE